MTRRQRILIVAVAVALAVLGCWFIRRPDAATRKYHEGLEALNRGDHDQAIACFTEIVRKHPNDAASYYCRGLAHDRNRDYDRARADFGMVIHLEPGNDDAYLARARAYFQTRDYERALDDYNTAIQLAPREAAGYLGRGITHHRLKQYDQALADYKAAQQLDPQNADVLNSLAWLLATCVDPSVRDGHKAVSYATEACTRYAWNNAYGLGTLAAAYADVGKFDEAVKWQQKALQAAEPYCEDDLEDAERRLKLYAEHKPYRDE